MRGKTINPSWLLVGCLCWCSPALLGCEEERPAPLEEDELRDAGPPPVRPPPSPPVGADDTDDATDDETDDPATDDSDPEDAGADTGPIVEILAPADQSAPDEVHDESIDVSCKVAASEAAGAREIDPSTVVIELLDSKGEVTASTVGVRGDSADVYVASFPTQNLPSGRVGIRCTGADDGAEPQQATHQVDVYIDHGPVVTVITPQEGQAESALGAVVFEYEVLADTLVKDDLEADVTEVTLSILGQRFALAESDEEPGMYRISIDFADSDVFKEIPSGPLLVSLSATNVRGITHSERYEFILDGEGPEITVVSPVDTSIVGGTTQITLKAVDEASSVDWETLIISLNDVSYPYEEDGPWKIDGENLVYTFESGTVEGSTVQINVNATVKDAAGNASPPAAVLYYRDEVAPIISLDPPNFRQIDLSRDPRECSVSFDPIGISPPNGARVQDLEMYRALVWDDTNFASGINIYHYAGVDRDSVALFARRADGPLVIDTTGDGRCDDIDQEGTRFQELTAIDSTGSALYQIIEGEEDVSPAMGGRCVPVDRNPPPQLCEDEASDLTIVIAHNNAEEEAVIYAVSPDTGLECTGRQWELRSAGLQGYQGWVCLAVLGYDNVGNRGVSKPIAVCLDNDQVDGQPSCHTDLNEPAPNCTDGCSDPPAFAEGFAVP